jgi:hypothetical protein
MNTHKTFEDVQEKVENDVYSVVKANELTEGLYVELRGDGSYTDGNSVTMLQYYMEDRDEFEKVREKYM